MKVKIIFLMVMTVMALAAVSTYFLYTSGVAVMEGTSGEGTLPIQLSGNQQPIKVIGQNANSDGGLKVETRDSIDNEIRDLELKVKSPQMSQAELEKAQKRLNMLRVIKAKIVEEMMEKTTR
jgi:flagellar basal body-associated protein FliL